MNLQNKYIGIVQGRLTFSKQLQKFPKNPFKEFQLARKLGYDFVELITERKFNKNNPIWSQLGRKLLKEHAKKNGLKLLTACDDFIISSGFNKKYLIYAQKLIKFLAELGIKKFILPLEGKALVTKYNLKKTIFYLNKISKICFNKNISYFLIESNCDFQIFKKIKNSIHKKKIFFLYDLGNRVEQYPNVYQDILKFSNNIKSIHLKDKNKYGDNVLIGKGNVNFNIAFKAIKRISQKNLSFCYENNRGKNPIFSAKKNINLFKKLIKK